MGEVTIDSIQIEIESNSMNASNGLDALAGSLEKLKKNGSFKTVSTNLNNLSAALKNLPNVHSTSNSFIRNTSKFLIWNLLTIFISHAIIYQNCLRSPKMKLVLIIGSGAVGKMTVGQELMKITDLRLFHNHMMIEPVLEIFNSFNGQVIGRLREVVFEEFLKTDNEGMIFTYMWAFDMPSDREYVMNVASKFDQVYCVELIADRAVRLERNKTENRLKNKASKRDTAASDKRLINEETKYRLVSFPGEIPFENYLRIDNTNLAPHVVAQMIKDSFSL